MMTVNDIIGQAKQLTIEERKLLIKQLIDTLTAPPDPPGTERTSLLELAGLGQHIWQGIDAQEYIDDLRDEWD